MGIGGSFPPGVAYRSRKKSDAKGKLSQAAAGLQPANGSYPEPVRSGNQHLNVLGVNFRTGPRESCAYEGLPVDEKAFLPSPATSLEARQYDPESEPGA